MNNPASKTAARFVSGKNQILAVVLLVVAALCLRAQDASAQGIKLKVKMPDLCYSCHPELKKELTQASVHFVFKQGMCGACHNLHASDHKAMIRDDINTLCLGCHKELKQKLDQGGVHTAVSDGKCTDCHKPHSSPNPMLLVAAQKELCWKCHQKTQAELKNAVKHPPFDQGECSTCHDPHSSPNEYELKESANKLCQKCHAPRCSVKGVSISAATGKMECIRCHAGHDSQYKGLFGPYGHPPFLAEQCDSCHNAFAPGKPVTLKSKGADLCFGCHRKDPKDYKEGDIHGTFTEIPCELCHEFHAAGTPKLTKQPSRVCFQCHDDIRNKIAHERKVLPKMHPEKNCLDCHKPYHSSNPRYLKTDVVTLCSSCHKAEHKTTHPVGKGVIDPRTGKTLTCISCHSLHSAEADFMLQYDRKRQLCIQCHKGE